MINEARIQDALDALYADLTETGECVARGLGHPHRGPFTLDSWREGLRARAAADGQTIRTYAAKCECCATALLDNWTGLLGPIRLAFDAHEIAADRAATAETAALEQWRRFMNAVRGIDCE